MKTRSTTILGIRHKGKAAMAGDGQVTFGDTILKTSARKIRKMYDDTILVGFAGAAADALTLFDKFDAKLEQYKGNLPRAVVELAKEWRTDRYLRRLEAQLAVMDKNHSFLVSGTGDVIEPDDSILALGSGGPYALAAARALIKHTKLSAREIVQEAMQIAGSICIYTNTNIVIEEL
ncbi:MAG: ATP-dependent protease subunit HslV [candidate division KSB1 bacterium]|nr:ATP-dependent protease subunit HslV [candidate division KSB1 bacterium]MDZ7336844.1 ATP-dependent protease subunit HslV [candidate division KSB1 bacterium]MDZ7358901.1 ATP-dependent protease subunit HslV [candidate division KSB1 bacterium]MDZ7375974.1 ATP-dependent protease subunit HslV [candidate division KSB1 bacterium]MDZ7400401.1 ATP-dependent protease subunit HslV [candidate division KSB1 bacterium]